MNLREQIGTALKQIRNNKKMTANDIATKAGMTPVSVYNIEAGGRMSVDSVEAYLKAVGATLTITANQEP